MALRSRPGIPIATPLAALVVALTALAAAAFPLTGTPGPEAAQLLAAVGGPLLLIAGASRGSHRHERGFSGDMVAQGALLAVCFLGFVAVITVSSWGHESCAPGRGYLPFVALSLPVLVLDSALGLWLGRLIGNARVATLAAVALLAAYTGWLMVDWFLDPSFRVLTHLSILIEGDLLRGRDVSPAAWAFRMGTLLLGFGLCFLGSSSYPRARRGGLSAAPGSNPVFLITALALFATGLVLDVQASDALKPGRDALERAYSLERTRGKLTVRADPDDVNVRMVEGVLAEGALWLSRLEDRMGVVPEDPIVIWLHRSSAELGQWTGADHVHFALPMRSELHVAGPSVPHRTLGHELVHILGRQLSPTLLGVPSRLGVLTNSGLIEGLAMSMTPELEVSDGLTLREKAAAMRRAEIAPNALSLFEEYGSLFSFWRHNPGRAYVVAGAFMEALAAERGTEALRAAYATGDLEAAFGSREELEAFATQHQADLDAMELPADAVANVNRTYARPSILEETCDKRATAAAHAIRAAARAGDFDRAESLAREQEPVITGATLISLASEARGLDAAERSAEYLLRAARARDTRDPIERAERYDAAADAQWREGEVRKAIVLWGRVDEAVLPPYAHRLVIAKRYLATAVRAMAGEAPVARAALDFVLRNDDIADEAGRLALLVEALSAAQRRTREPSEVLAFAGYLVGRQYVQRGALDDGIDVLLRIVESGVALPPPFDVELLRALAMGHARRGDYAIARLGFEKIAQRDVRPAVRIALRDRAERAARMAAAAEGEGADEADRFLLGYGRSGGL